MNTNDQESSQDGSTPAESSPDPSTPAAEQPDWLTASEKLWLFLQEQDAHSVAKAHMQQRIARAAKRRAKIKGLPYRIYKQREFARDHGFTWAIIQPEKNGYDGHPYREFHFRTKAGARAHFEGELKKEGTISQLENGEVLQ
jgi:hypothetical protein